MTTAVGLSSSWTSCIHVLFILYILLIALMSDSVRPTDAQAENTTTTCPQYEFQCEDGSRCVSVNFVCDGWFTCPDRSDERHCGDRCRSGLECGGGVCVPEEDVCDGVRSCQDGGDEGNCTTESCPRGRTEEAQRLAELLRQDDILRATTAS